MKFHVVITLIFEASFASNCYFNLKDYYLTTSSTHNLFIAKQSNSSCLVHSPAVDSDNLIYRLNGLTSSSSPDNEIKWSPSVIETSLVHHFASDKNLMKNSFVADNDGDRGLHVLSPGILQLPSKRFYVVSRIWFSSVQFDLKNSKYIYENTYPENLIYQQVFSDDFSREEMPGLLLPIPHPNQFRVGGGPSDPRIFKLGESIVVLFYMARDIENPVGRMFLWDATKHRLYQPKIENFKLASIESNWTPFEFGGKLHFIYMFNPLRVVRCEFMADVVCRFVFELPRGSLLPSDGCPNVHDLLDSNTLILRGGTPLLHYVTTKSLKNSLESRSYYLAVIHSTVSLDVDGNLDVSGKRRYNAHFVLMQIAADNQNQLTFMCIVFISKKLKVNSQAFERARLVLSDEIAEPFIYPVGLVLEEASNNKASVDCVLVSYHISDDQSFVSRFCGLKSLLAPAISKESACLTEKLEPETINKLVVQYLI